MKKSLRFLIAAACLVCALFYVSTAANAAAPVTSGEAVRPQPAADAVRQWPVAKWYHKEGDVWPPVAGRYERKLANGLANAYINVTLLPDQWPVINLHACDYDGPNDEHGWEALDTNPGIWLGGTIMPAQMGLGARFVIGGKTVGMYRGNGVRETLPKAFNLNSGITLLKDRIIVDFSRENPKGIPDIRGEYVLNKKDSAFADEYSAYALLEILPKKETETDFFDKSLQIIPALITSAEAAKYDKLIGDYSVGDFGYAIKVFKNGVLLRTFIVTRDLSAVYRFEGDGNGVMIYNIDGSKG